MTGDTNGPGHGDRFPKSTEEELNRWLIEEFYKNAVARYGLDSEQSRALSRFLSPVDSEAPKKNS